MFPCVCSVIDRRRRQNVVRISVTHSFYGSCATFLFLPYFDARQHWIYLLNRFKVRILWSLGEGSSEKICMMVTGNSTTWAEVIFWVKRKVFVTRWCYKSGPLKLIGQFSQGGIGCKSPVKVDNSQLSVPVFIFILAFSFYGFELSECIAILNLPTKSIWKMNLTFGFLPRLNDICTFAEHTSTSNLFCRRVSYEKRRLSTRKEHSSSRSTGWIIVTFRSLHSRYNLRCFLRRKQLRSLGQCLR